MTTRYKIRIERENEVYSIVNLSLQGGKQFSLKRSNEFAERIESGEFPKIGNRTRLAQDMRFITNEHKSNTGPKRHLPNLVFSLLSEFPVWYDLEEFKNRNFKPMPLSEIPEDQTDMHLFKPKEFFFSTNFHKKRLYVAGENLIECNNGFANQKDISNLFDSHEKLSTLIWWGMLANQKLIHGYAQRHPSVRKKYYIEQTLDDAAENGLRAALMCFDPRRGNLSTVTYHKLMSTINREIEAQNKSLEKLSLEHYHEKGNSSAEKIETESAARYFTLKDALSICNLNPKERAIIIARHGLNGTPEQTLKELGKFHGITRERVRQIQNKALKKLRKSFASIYKEKFKETPS